jgi:hypothetical protein
MVAASPWMTPARSPTIAQVPPSELALTRTVLSWPLTSVRVSRPSMAKSAPFFGVAGPAGGAPTGGSAQC